MNIGNFKIGDTVIITGYGQSIQIGSFVGIEGIEQTPPSITGKVSEIEEKICITIGHPVFPGGFVKFFPVEHYNCYKAESNKTGQNSCLKMLYPFFLETKKTSLPAG